MRYPGSGETGDHPPGRAIASAGSPDDRHARHPADDVLPVVCPPAGGRPEALEDKPSWPRRVWNKIPEEVREQIVELALDEPELSPREVATRFTDVKKYFVSEASFNRLLNAHDLITSPDFIVVTAADEFKDKTTAPNQMWQTDFTYFKVITLGLVLPVDHPRRLLTLHHRLEAVHDDESRGCDRHTGFGAHGIGLRERPGRPSATSAERQWFLVHRRRSGGMARGPRHQAHPGGTLPSPQTQGKIERRHQTLKNRILLENYYLPCDLESQINAFVDHYNLQRYH